MLTNSRERERVREFECDVALLTLNDVRAYGYCFCDAVDDVLRQRKHRRVVIHVNHVHNQLQQHRHHSSSSSSSSILLSVSICSSETYTSYRLLTVADKVCDICR